MSGIVCFPIDISDSWKGNFGMKMHLKKEKENEIKSNFASKGTQVFMLDKSDELNELIYKCIEYFQQ